MLVGILPDEVGWVGANVGLGRNALSLKRNEVVRRDADRVGVKVGGLDDDRQLLAFGELLAGKLTVATVSLCQCVRQQPHHRERCGSRCRRTSTERFEFVQMTVTPAKGLL